MRGGKTKEAGRVLNISCVMYRLALHGLVTWTFSSNCRSRLFLNGRFISSKYYLCLLVVGVMDFFFVLIFPFLLSSVRCRGV